ncbi:MAG: carbamoyl transferase [bacterium]|nr:carbamoyl transferase [bacterium]
MKILGIYWGLSSTAALLIDNKIQSAVSEERFTRIKNDDVFPAQAIRYVLEANGLKAEDLDGVAIASNEQYLPYSILQKARWSIDDYVREQTDRWYPRIYEGKQVSDLDVFEDKVNRDLYPQDYWAKSAEGLKQQVESFSEDRKKIFADFLGVDQSKVRTILHHKAHAYYGYYSSPFRQQDVLSITMDGWGDNANGSIGVFNPQGDFRFELETVNCNIARIYRYITLVLGMKPNEHEYKVMGLAPYGKERIAQKPYELFKQTLVVDGIDFKWNVEPKDSYFWFRDRLQGCRFDGIAAGLQRWAEELLTEWVANAVDRFGIGQVVLSGGASMNIRANGKIAELPGIEQLFVGGSGSDESLALGSAFCMAEDLHKERGTEWKPQDVPYLERLYLGPESNLEKEKAAVGALDDRYIVEDQVDSARVAALLADGKILARCAGPMEFGQRSLGNRSILADPTVPDVIGTINAAIKNRDFWMPFAPVVLDTDAPRYVLNPKNLRSPHMTIGFDSTPVGWDEMRAGCHPADRSARAQILTEAANPGLYAIITEFKKQTGRAALINTSFNLHGYPIVNTPEEAIDVLERSGLDGLVLNHFVVLKK